MTTPETQSRQYFRTLRRLLTPDQQQQHARLLSRHLCNTGPVRNAGRIACYLANDGEIGTGEIIETAWSRRQQVYLPALSPLGNSLFFAPYNDGDSLVYNRFGIAEPACSPRKWISARQVDVVLMPLVAFDDAGNRIGMGGGFYDRSLAFMQHREHRRKPFLIGLAHEIQRAEFIDARRWDIPLHAIATELRYTAF